MQLRERRRRVRWGRGRGGGGRKGVGGGESVGRVERKLRGKELLWQGGAWEGKLGEYICH